MCAIELEPAIRTKRLRLRGPRVGDARRIAELANDFEIVRMTRRMPHPYREDDARAFIDGMGRSDPARERAFAIEHEEEGLVGMLGFHPAAMGSELGYWLGRPYWGRGYATEAAMAAVAWARDGWGRRIVVAGHFDDNPASAAVLCKAGFLYTGQVELEPCLARGEPARSRSMVWLA